MGRLRTKPSRFSQLNAMNQSFFSHIHRARVIDTYVANGTVNAMIEGTDVVLTVYAPLLALSLPPKQSDTDTSNGGKAAWAKYIPQVGDLLLIGFDTNGEPYSLGYHAVYYKGFDTKDYAAESSGGIGWGEASGIRLEPGDFDFYSKRNSRMMLTDKATFASGPHVLTLNQSKGDATLTSTLSIVQYGEASEHRQGGVRRFLLPTDSEETDIYGIFGSIAQESTDVVKRGMVGTPGIEMCRTSLGEVIDELTFLPMVPVVTYPDLNTMTGTGTRIFRSVKDPSGATELYSELVDDLGNYGVSAMSALGFQWFTPAATWTTLNAITDWTTSGMYTLTVGGDLSMTAANASITAAQVALGADSASEFLVKGTTFVTALNVFLTAVTAAVAVVGTAPQNAAALTAIGTAAGILQGSLSTALSTVTKTV